MNFKVRIDVLQDETEQLVGDMQEDNFDPETLLRAQRDLADAFTLLRALVK